MSFSEAPRFFLQTFLFALTIFSAVFVPVPEAKGAVTINNKGILGVIKGTVRDEAGSPIADAYVSFFKVGTSQLLKRVRSSANGSFLAKVLPGTYKVLAVAQGYNPVTYDSVEINRSAELNYKFNLERAGSGNTLPEKRSDRRSSKWVIRQSALSTSIYQNQDNETPIEEVGATENSTTAESQTPENTEEAEREEKQTRPGQTVIETFAASSNGENFAGTNFATLLPVTENTQIVLAGQTATSLNAPQRFEASITSRLSDEHQIRINTGLAT